MAVFVNLYHTGVLVASVNAGATAITLLNTMSAVLRSGIPCSWNLMNSGVLFPQYMSASGMFNLEGYTMQVSGA